MPLADLLSPMIARKALELQTQLPPVQGYLQAQQSMGANPGQIAQPTAPPQAPPGGYADQKALAQLRADAAKPKSPLALFVGGANVGAAKEKKRQQMLGLIPNANPQGGAPIATDERGRPVYAGGAQPAMPMVGAHGNQMLLPPGAVAIDEKTGQALDVKGKKLGYLNSGNTPAGTAGQRDLLRRPENVVLNTHGQPLLTKPDAAEAAWLQQMYGQHLKALNETRDENGVPLGQFPKDYFQGVPKEQRKNIERGTKALQQLERDQMMGPLT